MIMRDLNKMEEISVEDNAEESGGTGRNNISSSMKSASSFSNEGGQSQQQMPGRAGHGDIAQYINESRAFQEFQNSKILNITPEDHEEAGHFDTESNLQNRQADDCANCRSCQKRKAQKQKKKEKKLKQSQRQQAHI